MDNAILIFYDPDISLTFKSGLDEYYNDDNDNNIIRYRDSHRNIRYKAKTPLYQRVIQ